MNTRYNYNAYLRNQNYLGGQNYLNSQNYLRDLNNPTLFSDQEGFMKGNMFQNLYSPYKNYQPAQLTPRNEQEEMFLRMVEAEFAMHDLNLYLDLYPQDGNALNLFNQYRKKSNELRNAYEDKYGPILINSNSLDTSPFLWQTQIFPWNMEGLNNV